MFSITFAPTSQQQYHVRFMRDMVIIYTATAWPCVRVIPLGTSLIFFGWYLSLLIYQAFRYTGVLMNPTYATASMYGCPGKINRDHFAVFWIGPIVGALVFKDVVKIVQTMCTWCGYWFQWVGDMFAWQNKVSTATRSTATIDYRNHERVAKTCQFSFVYFSRRNVIVKLVLHPPPYDYK